MSSSVNRGSGYHWATSGIAFRSSSSAIFWPLGVLLAVGSTRPDIIGTDKSPGPLRSGIGEVDLFRSLFFVMTFFSIGMASNFKKLWAEGLAKLAAVYVVCLFGFIIWIGLAISWLFFHGYLPTAGFPEALDMNQSNPEPTAAVTERQTAEEMARITYEPLLPVEKKLIVGSLVLGAILLGILLWTQPPRWPLFLGAGSGAPERLVESDKMMYVRLSSLTVRLESLTYIHSCRSLSKQGGLP